MILEAKIKTAEEEPETELSKAKTKRKKSPWELYKEFINEIKSDEKNIIEQTFKEYFFYHAPLFLAKEYNSDQNLNNEIVKHINDALTEIKKDVSRKKLPENVNPNKIVDIVEKMLEFIKQQKGKGLPLDLAPVTHVAKVSDHSNLKILTSIQMLQKLP